jgi:ABC-2 type transport system permease protein
MRDTVRIFAKLTAAELRLFLREPMLVFFAVLFPSVLIVILGGIPAFRLPSADLDGLRVIDVYVPIALLLILAMLALQVTPMVLATYRERGVLRRLGTTPARPVALLGAQLVLSMLTAIVSAVLVLAIARLAFDVRLPAQAGSFVLAFLLSAAAVFAIGLVIAAVVPGGKAANSVGTLLFFPSMFFAGLWTPREVLPAVIRRIGDFTPLGAGERALHDAATGDWPNPLSVTVLVAYILVFGLAATKLFRWE